MYPSIHPNTVDENYARDLHAQGKIGDRGTSSRWNRQTTMTNRDPQAAQVTTLTLSGAMGLAFIATIGGLDTEIIGATNLTASATALAAAINANPDARGLVSAESAGAVVTLSGLVPGQATPVSGSANIAVVETVSAAKAPSIPVGRLVLFAGYSSKRYDAASKLCKQAIESGMPSQVDRLELMSDEDLFIALTVEVLGLSVTVVRETAGTAAANVTALIAAFELDTRLTDLGLVFSDGGVGPNGGQYLEITTGAELTTGFDFSYQVSNAVATPFGAFESNRLGADIAVAAAGVSMAAHDEEYADRSGTEVVYPPNAGVKVATMGSLWVEIDPTEPQAMPGGTVWVSLLAEDAGKMYTQYAVGRRPLPLDKAHWLRGTRPGSSAPIAEIALNFRS